MEIGSIEKLVHILHTLSIGMRVHFISLQQTSNETNEVLLLINQNGILTEYQFCGPT